MATLYTFRLFITIPEKLGYEFGRWFAANIDPNDDTSTWPKSNRTGKARQLITHRTSNGSYTDQQAQLIANKIAELSRQSIPDWTSMTFDQRVAWFNNTRTDSFKVAGVYPVSAVNTSNTWPDSAAAYTAVKVEPVTDVGQPGSTIFAVQVWADRELPSDWVTANNRSTKDFFVSDMVAELTLTGNGTLAFRQGLDNSGWLVTLQLTPLVKVLLWKVAPPTGPRVVAERTFITGVKSKLTVRTSGDSIEVSLDGVPVIQHVDAYNNTKTRHGFTVNSAWTTFTVRQ